MASPRPQRAPGPPQRHGARPNAAWTLSRFAGGAGLSSPDGASPGFFPSAGSADPTLLSSLLLTSPLWGCSGSVSGEPAGTGPPVASGSMGRVKWANTPTPRPIRPVGVSAPVVGCAPGEGEVPPVVGRSPGVGVPEAGRRAARLRRRELFDAIDAGYPSHTCRRECHPAIP